MEEVEVVSVADARHLPEETSFSKGRGLDVKRARDAAEVRSVDVEGRDARRGQENGVNPDLGVLVLIPVRRIEAVNPRHTLFLAIVSFPRVR